MSFHVYVARAGFKSNPIGAADWIDAARQCPELDVRDEFNRAGVRIYLVQLKSHRRQQLSLDPHGLIHTQDPNQELVEVMFKLAGLLDAGVYSEKLKRFQSVNDWRDRTNSYRVQRNLRLAVARKNRHRRLAISIAIIAASSILGWFIGGKNVG